MNYLILTCGFVCLVLAVNGELPDEHLADREKCYQEMGLEKDSIPTSTYREDPKSKCFLKCLMRAVKAIKEDDSWDFEQSVALIPEAFREEARPLINACIAKTSSIDDKCEKPFEGIKCLEDGAPSGLISSLGMFAPPTTA